MESSRNFKIFFVISSAERDRVIWLKAPKQHPNAPCAETPVHSWERNCFPVLDLVFRLFFCFQGQEWTSERQLQRCRCFLVINDTEKPDGCQMSEKILSRSILPHGPALLDTAEVSYRPCRGSYWAWAESWFCPSAAMLWSPDHLHPLLLPGTKIDSSDVRFTVKHEGIQLFNRDKYWCLLTMSFGSVQRTQANPCIPFRALYLLPAILFILSVKKVYIRRLSPKSLPLLCVAVAFKSSSLLYYLENNNQEDLSIFSYQHSFILSYYSILIISEQSISQ